MSHSQKRTVLEISGRIIRPDFIIKDQEAQVIDFETHRKILLEEKARQEALRPKPPPVPPPQESSEDLAMKFTAEMRGTDDKPGRWPNLGEYIAVMVKSGLEDNQPTGLDKCRAKRLVDAIHSRLEQLNLRDVSLTRIATVIRGGSEMADQVVKSALRSHLYSESFEKSCSSDLRTYNTKLEDFKQSGFWLNGYKPIVLAVFLCVESELIASKAQRQAQR